MAKTSPFQTNFSGGELSPRLAARADLNKYKDGATTLENFLVFPQGGITRRPGTRMVASTKNRLKKSRLVPFIYSTVRSYMLEFGDLYIRFYRDGAQIAATEVVTPYTEAELFELEFVQSADVLYIAHKNHATAKLSRTSDTSWTLADIAFTEGPFQDANTTATTISASGTTGTVTLTATSAIFLAGHVGYLFRKGSGYVRITVVTGPPSTTATATVLGTITTGAETDWAEGSWNTVRGFPGAIAFHEQRLVLAGSTAFPFHIWGSTSQDFEDFTAGTSADNAYTFIIASTQADEIQWLSSSRSLIIGTQGGEYSMSGPSGAVTPTSVSLKRETGHGCSRVTPVQVGNKTIFVQRQGRKLREVSYSFQEDANIAPDITVLSEHITEGGITQLSYQQEPNSVIWGIRNDGQLIGLTYDKDNEVYAWHRHVTDGYIESVATIPTTDGTSSEVWLVVKRMVTTQGIVVTYKFDEVSGITAHDSAGDNDATLIGMSPADSRWVAGLHGNALAFNGYSGYVGAPSAAFPSSGAFSYCTFVNPGVTFTVATVEDATIFNYFDNVRLAFCGTTGDPDVVAVPGTVTLRIRTGTNPTDWMSISSTTVSWTVGTWYFIGATYDGAEMKLYVGDPATGVLTLQAALSGVARYTGA